MEEYDMNDSDLIRKLNEINEYKKQSMDLIKQDIGIINEIIYNSLNAGEVLYEQSFPIIPQKAVMWNFLGGIKNIFFIKNSVWFNITCENNVGYLGIPPNTIKVESANDDIIIEYIEFLLSNKNIILSKIDLKLKTLKKVPEQLRNFINCFQDKCLKLASS